MTLATAVSTSPRFVGIVHNVQGRVTNGLRLGWVPTLRFYEQKLAMLQKLEESGVMHQFFVTEKDTGARVGDFHHEIRVGARGILAVIYPPEESAAPVTEAIADALGRFSPVRLRSMSVFTQHVIPMSASYDDARASLTRAIAGVAAGRSGADSGILFEYDTDRGHVNAQYGIVDHRELSELLLGGVLPSHPPRDAMAGRKLSGASLPDCSLYVEADHQIDVPEGRLDGARDFVLDTWSAALQESDATAEDISSHLEYLTTQKGSVQ